MKKIIKPVLTLMFFTVLFTGSAFASGSGMKGHDMSKSDRIGDLIHESMVKGYMLSYYFMDLRDQKNTKHSMDKSHDMKKKDMDKPHHLMVYIMDKNHNPVLKGKVGFLIKDNQGKAQKAMGMFMSKGFGIMADMKKKGVYKVTTKAVLGDEKLMDNFDYKIN